MSDVSQPLGGRQAEARRNDGRILDAALSVFAEDTKAPMSTVAQRAGVGQASLYRRYPSKDELLVEVCERGITRIGEAAKAAVAARDLGGFLVWYVDSGTLRLAALLGAFTPPERLHALAHDVNLAIDRLVADAVAAGDIRPDITGADVTLLATQVGAVEVGNADRTRALRRRYLALVLQGLAQTDAEPLPGPAPDSGELEAPWRALQG